MGEARRALCTELRRIAGADVLIGRTSAEELLVGLIALVLLPLIGWRIARGLREGRLPLYRTYQDRVNSAAKFKVLLVLHALAFLLIAVVAVDLLLGLGLRERL
jgi:uncharacterized membrane-anchored protein